MKNQKSLLQKTRNHYDQYHFIEGGENRIAWWRDYLRDFLPDEQIRDKQIVDVGSSVGEIAHGLADRGARMTGLDLSYASLKRCKQINPGMPILNGNALELPFHNATFDHAISIGVLHHTPDARRGFREVARVTKPGGIIVIFLYNFYSIYNVIFQLWAPVRALLPLDRVPHWMIRTMQPFVKNHLHQTLGEKGLLNLLGDALWTPQATFHSVGQIEQWGKEEGLQMVGVKKFYLHYANVMKFIKDRP